MRKLIILFLLLFTTSAFAQVDYVPGYTARFDARYVNISGDTMTGSLTSPNFISDVAIGTQPYACTSTTLNTNLNADLWDGYQFADYLDQAVKTTSSPTFAKVIFTNGSSMYDQATRFFFQVQSARFDVLNEAGNRYIMIVSSGVLTLYDQSGTADSNRYIFTDTNGCINLNKTTGHIKHINDSQYYYAGAANDAGWTYDSTDMLVNTALVGTGVLKFASAGNWGAGGAGAGTLTNAPSAGNPVSWLQVKDNNGNVRQIPAW